MSTSSTLLKIMSIVIIFGIIVLIAGIITATGGVLVAGVGAGILGAIVILAALLSIVEGLLFLLCGVFGIRGSKLGACFIMAVVILIAQVVGFIIGVTSGAPNYLGIVGIVLTILYLIGVRQSQRA